MNRYQTQFAEVELSEPRHLCNANAIEIVRYYGDHITANKTEQYMAAVAKAIFDPTNWKNACYAEMPHIRREWVKAAIMVYHGSVPIEVYGGIHSQGYACN